MNTSSLIQKNTIGTTIFQSLNLPDSELTK
jgi:hypothetical protein